LHTLEFPELEAESNVVMLRLLEQIVNGDLARGGVVGLSMPEDAARYHKPVKKELDQE